MYFGNHGTYFWLESPDLHLVDLLGIHPQIVEGRYVTVTAFDSGPLRLMEEERALGWIDQNSLAYSPRIEKVAWVPRGEYDEWYTFLTSARINMPEVFVNDSGFTLRDPRQDLKNLDPTWDKKMHVEWSEIILEKQFRFWRQMQAIMPESYIAEGDRLIFVTNSLGHYEAIRQHFQKRT